ncbi:hypothetical protein TIFTF001_037153 [Ficus carica]|uniref:Uncharacterized protein n=1 Tax=Ficus carica TaxID=3494 RepID=A0AA88E5L7_FICCA|nr:hypothetical protein TIFTF001_037153 [Ficus carica]
MRECRVTGFLGGTFDGIDGRGVGRQWAKTRRRWVGDDVLTGSAKALESKGNTEFCTEAHDGRESILRTELQQ